MDRSASIATHDLAERVLELYWPQTAPFGSDTGALVLAQNRGGQSEIVSAIRKLREGSAIAAAESLNRVRLHDTRRYTQLLRTVEWKLIEMPLPRLQVIGDSSLETLYRIGWSDTVKRRDIEAAGFDAQIHLLPGVADALVRMSGILRPLIQQRWAAMVATMNRSATDEARLQEFLFGAERISLDPVRQDLRELQNNRCFYCDDRLGSQVHVDHFVPWSRHPDNGIDNLVVADVTCNGNKSDYLAAGEHVERWVQRLTGASSLATQLADIATHTGFERHPERTLGAASAVYLRLPGEVRLWRRRNDFSSVAAERAALHHAFGRAGEYSVRG